MTCLIRTRAGGVDWPATERHGLLTHPAVLAVHGRGEIAPVARGMFVRRRLLCQGVPTPPDGVDTTLPETGPNASPRERWDAHVSNPTCATCHNYIDPLGWPFEQYDQLGRWREQHNGWIIEAHGELVGSDVDGPVAGPIELAERLSQSTYVEACVAQQMFVYAHGREISAGDECDMRDIVGAFNSANGDLRELVAAVVGASSFEERRVELE